MKYCSLFFFILWGAGNLSAQLVVSDLTYNPVLYHRHFPAGAEAAMKSLPADNFLVYPDTLQLPFSDDFSKYHLKPYDTAGLPVVMTIYSTLLKGAIYELKWMRDTSWNYSFNVLTQQVDSTPKAPFQFIFHNDPGNTLQPTDTITGWPLYYRYTFDSLTGNVVDSTEVSPDSVIRYSVYHLVKDTRAYWMDNYAFINDNYPARKLSYGVATLDGLNAYGLPHNANSGITYGPADTLTSKPINLLGLDTSGVILSFLYQTQGLGDRPDEEDSLILEFKLTGNVWERIWATPGSDSILTDTSFRYVEIDLGSLPNKAFYFTGAFQFRFRNYASITGNNDHWHLDYVYLNRNRTAGTGYIEDLAIGNAPSNFLKNYTSMPWEHFRDFKQQEMQGSFSYSIHNNYNTTQEAQYYYYAYERHSGTPIYTDADINTQITPFGTLQVTRPDSTYFASFAPANTDTVIIATEARMVEINANPVSKDNDTVASFVHFVNYFAYDDGSAEKAIGLQGSGLKKFAYEFKLNKDDSLRAILIHFTQINYQLTTQEFTITVWRSIDLDNDGVGEDTLYARDGVRFQYLPEYNAFGIYPLDSAVFIPAGIFYVGWQQLLEENFQVGLDLNNDARQHVFYYTDGKWKQSIIRGAPMIRPVVGPRPLPLPTAITKPQADAGKVYAYPNPATDKLYFAVPQPPDKIEIFNLNGARVATFHQPGREVDVSSLAPGLYCARLLVAGKKSWSIRFIKL
ncbi:MAG: hypothetical protein KatS3mg031_0412 [Chitinophagales bacterium]|nr:MAG: hypothetical protein KatS3mg031_0412 [Chitinophagales bacterium]